MKETKLPISYIYPAVFTYYGKGKEIAVDFPDLEVATSGVDDKDALHSAKELLGLTLASMEEDGEDIPNPSMLSDVSLEENEVTVLVEVYMPSVRLEKRNKSVNRTVTLPAWLNEAALEQGVNFSQVLQDALKEQLQAV